jgi:hypothetical protein
MVGGEPGFAEAAVSEAERWEGAEAQRDAASSTGVSRGATRTPRAKPGTKGSVPARERVMSRVGEPRVSRPAKPAQRRRDSESVTREAVSEAPMASQSRARQEAPSASVWRWCAKERPA